MLSRQLRVGDTPHLIGMDSSQLAMPVAVMQHDSG